MYPTQVMKKFNLNKKILYKKTWRCWFL